MKAWLGKVVSVVSLAKKEGVVDFNYVEVYKSVLDFYRKYSKVENTDKYWENVIDESEQISRKYNKQKFVVDLLVSVISELERKGKELMSDEVKNE